MKTRVTAAELYRLRWLTVFAEKKALEARRAQNNLRDAVLRLEAKYRLLGGEAVLDVHTGVITRRTEEASDEPVRSEDEAAQRPAR